jgi:hypothetical protein
MQVVGYDLLLERQVSAELALIIKYDNIVYISIE